MADLRFFTAGESHGKVAMAVVEGYPAGVPIDTDWIDRDLTRRQAGYGRGGRMKIEKDKIEFLTGVRKAVGDTMTIDLDFSQSLSLAHCRPDIAIPYIQRLEEFDLQAVEQPLGQDELEGMAKIAQAIDTPLVADESVVTAADALRVIRMGAADVIKLKIMKVGGFYPALQIAALCRTAGVPMTIGHGFAGNIQNAAEAHLALALTHLKLPGEMNGFHRIGDDVADGLSIEDGDLLMPAGPGLGVQLRQEALKA